MNSIPKRYYKMVKMQEDEEIIEVIRQSLASIWYKFCFGIILVLLPFFLMFYLISQGPIGSSLFVALIAVAIFYCFREWFLWTRNAVIVTNFRVIDHDQHGLFHRAVSDVTHEKILDISFQSKGMLRTILGIGHIIIKTSIPDLKIAIFNVASVPDVTSRLSQTVTTSTGEEIEPRMRSAEESDTEDYDEYELKDLIENYIDRYSRPELKKLIYKEIEKHDRDR